MGYETYNVKVPESAKSLKANQVHYLVENSLSSRVSRENLAKFLEKDTGASRRVAKALANRVTDEDLDELHESLESVANSNGRLEIDYDGSRNYITLVRK